MDMTRLIVTAAALALAACQGERAEPAANAAENRAEALAEQADAAPAQAPANMAEEEVAPGGNAAEKAGAAGNATGDVPATASRAGNAAQAAAAPVRTAPPAAARAAAASPNRANGARIFAQACVACHGRDGKGAIPGVPDLTAAGGRLSKSDSVLLRNMINGFQSSGSPMAMPPRGGNPSLTDRDMADVLAHLRATFGRR